MMTANTLPPLDLDNPALTMVHVTREGSSTTVAVYFDDVPAQRRRIYTARIPLGVGGKIKRGAVMELQVTHCDGYDAEKHQWGRDYYGNRWAPLDRATAQQLLDLATCVAVHDRYHAPHGTRRHANYYRRG